MENKFYRLFLLLFFLVFIDVAFSQTTQSSQTYFSPRYSQQPVITLKEGFFNKTSYYLDGEKSSPKDVAHLLNSVQNEDFKFQSYLRKKNLGTGIRLVGMGVTIGSIAYLFTNAITPANVRPWFWTSFGGGILQSTGNILIDDSERRIERTINDFNAYHHSGGAAEFLSMDKSAGLFGTKIDIYEGPMLLQKDEVLSRMTSNEDAYRIFDQVYKRQKTSAVINVLNSALGIGILFVALGPERQSSTQNQLLLPMTFTGIGLNLFSSFFDRRSRNLTREALHRYNYQ